MREAGTSLPGKGLRSGGRGGGAGPWRIMTAIVGFAGPDYGLLAVDRNVIGRLSDGTERVLSRDGGKLHAGPDGYFAGAGKARLLAAVARRVAESTEPAKVARAMRDERKARYAKARAGRRPDGRHEPERSFGVLLRKQAADPVPGMWVLRPEDAYRPSKVAPGRPLVTGPEAEEMVPLVGALRLIFVPTPGPDALARNLELLHLYFWLRNRLDPVISADFDLALITPTKAWMETHANHFASEPQRAEQMAAWLQDLGLSFRKLAKIIRQKL